MKIPLPILLSLATLTTSSMSAPAEADRTQWFREARFGMFIHWGVYAVPAGEWEGQTIKGIGEWIMRFKKIPVEKYKSYAPEFTASKYDPEQWAKLAERAGMKYVVITSKHHDGFALYDSAVTDWDVMASGAKRDLLDPLAKAVRARGMKFGLYYSQSQDWTHPGGATSGEIGKIWDPAQKGDYDQYLKTIALPQAKEIIDRYDPAILWWDTPMQMTPQRVAPFAQLMAEHPHIINNNRLGEGFQGDTMTPEQHIPPRGFPGKMFEVCMTMNDTWGYKKNDKNWKSSQRLIQMLSDIASKGGNLLLNIGPRPDGSIPEESVDRLEAIARWMEVNSQAIHATTASPFPRRLPWGRITQKPGEKGGITLYLHVWDWPSNGKILLPTLKELPASGWMLEGGASVTAERTADGIVVRLPGKSTDPDVSVARLEFPGALTITQEPFNTPAADGTLVLPALDADPHGAVGGNIHVEGTGADAYLTDWKQQDYRVEYRVRTGKMAKWNVLAEISANEAAKLVMKSGDSTQTTDIPATGGDITWKTIPLGTIELPAEEAVIELKPDPGQWKPIHLRKLTLTPAPVSEELEKNFVNPPESAKPSGYWWWLNAYVDKEAITRDMEQFRAKGIGSVLLVCSGNWCAPADFRGPPFLSDEWRELYKFALKEANRVGIKVDVNIAPGWNMGGPWVTPDKAARWFLQSETTVKGPRKYSGKLPLPGVRDGYDSRPRGGVKNSLTLTFEQVDYRDTAVVAFRTPQGTRPAARADLPAKSNRLDAGCFITSDKVMSQTLAPWTTAPGDQPLRAEDVVDLTERMKSDGTLEWNVPEGDWTILRTGHRMTGALLNVPMPDQGGLENDYFDRAGVDLMFEKVGKVLIEDAGPLAGTTLRGFCEDSFEAGYPNWTANMLKHFKRYRGYDPTPYLPVFRGWIVGSAEISDRFLHDYRKTVADCFADEHYGRMAELCRQHNMVTRCESAGPSWSGTVCMDGLKNLGRTEFPQGEFWQDKLFVENDQNKVAKMVSAAAHIYGKRYVAAEALTDGTPGSWQWQVPPSRLKPKVDRAFCEGINQCVFSTMTCQKPSDGKPGNEYGSGTHFNPNVTWWDQAAGPWVGYINRCQALLQSGHFVADVLYYNGDWAPNLVGPKQIEQPGLGKGYDYDVCNAEVLLTRLSVKDGRIVLPACPSELGERSRDGMSYRVLVLPESKHMPVEVSNKIKELVQAGATIVGPKPESDPGLKGYPQCDAEVKKIAAEVWGACDGQQVKQNTYGKGRVFWGKTLGEIFQADGVAPDFTHTGDSFIDFIHRTGDGVEIYFLANRRNQVASVEASFRVSGMQPEAWDPVSGQRRDLPVFESKDGRTTVPLEFEPDGSMFIVFRKTKAGTDLRAVRSGNFPNIQLLQEIAGPWTIRFDPQWFYPTDGLSGDQTKGLMTFGKLEDWTQRPEPAVKHFSGTAVYRKVFDLNDPSTIRNPPSTIYLDLGVVKDTAKVKLNGKDLGVVWCHPWRVEITGALKSGENQLEIEVVNLWPNRLIGDTTLPEGQRRTRTNIAFDSKGKLLASGLLGPVRILTQSQQTGK